MRVEHNDKDTTEFLDEAAMSFMTLTVHRLNATLRANGIANAVARQNICASFLFEFAYHHDAGWLMHKDRKLFPLVTFADRAAPAEGQNLAPIEVLHVPTPASSWHEYAHGVVSEYFEDHNEEVRSLRFGSYDIEG